MSKLKRVLSVVLVVALVASVFAIQAFATEETANTPFAPYTDADGLRQYCACGNKFFLRKMLNAFFRRKHSF